MSDFVHLHCHTDYSLLDGATKIDQLVEKAHALQMRAVAITDHGNLFGAIEFYKKCKNTGVKPLIGMEGYIAVGSRFDRTRGSEKEPKYHHLILLAKDEVGYKNLMRLSSIGYLEGFYYRPRFDKEVLAKYSKGLVVTSACLQGEVAYHLARGNRKEAEKAIRWYKDVFGEDYYLEVQNHGIPEQIQVNREILELSKKYGIKVVASNDLHYLNHEDHFAHDVLLCIGTGSKVEETDRFRFDSDHFYLKTAAEMEQLFKDFPEALKNTLEVAEKCNVEIDFSKRYLPHFEPSTGEDPVTYFRRLCREGAKKRYGKLTSDVRKRLEHEMAVIEQMGFVSYFLIVQDFVQYAKRRGIPVGPGRGSAAGSMVAYVLGITDVDPLKYDLLFERFLNAERVSMPDIDIDFSHEGREEVIRYVTEKYGKDRVAQIITFGTLAARGVIRDVGRALGVPLKRVDEICKLIPPRPGMTLEKAMAEEPELRRLYEEGGEEIRRLFDIAKKLEGTHRHASTHAAGIVIGSKPLIELVPLYKNGDDVVTQFTMTTLEELGLLKMDFLGLKNLSIIDRAVKLIQRTHGVALDPLKFPLDDPKTYALLSRGDTKGVFQLESAGMRDVLVRLRPDKFEDVIALLALYRPGPLGSGMVDSYIRRKHGEEEITYPHPDLEPILKETYGVILYQEQVMRIANKLSGFTLNEADNLRKAMGKKKPEILAKFKERFIQGAVERGVDKDTAKHIFEQIEYFAGYGFNKSHSTAYAFITYQTAYLKANYPVEFMASLLTCEMGNPDKIVEYVEECRSMGIEVVPPDVNISEKEFFVQEGKIYYALNAIKGVGGRAVDAILDARKKVGEFTNLFHFCEHVDLRVCNKGVLEALIKSGAMDSLGGNRAQMMAVLDQAIREGNRLQMERESGQISLFGEVTESRGKKTQRVYPEVAEFPFREKLQYEKEALGFYLSGHPLKRYEALRKRYASCDSRTFSMQKEGVVILAALIQKVKRHTDRSGKPMAFLSLEDEFGLLDAVVFASVFERYSSLLQENQVLFFKGKVNQKNEATSLLVEEVRLPEEVDESWATSCTLEMDVRRVDPSHLLELQEVLLRHGGNSPLYLCFYDQKVRYFIKMPLQYGVRISRRLIEDLEELPIPIQIRFNAPLRGRRIHFVRP